MGEYQKRTWPIHEISDKWYVKQASSTRIRKRSTVILTKDINSPFLDIKSRAKTNEQKTGRGTSKCIAQNKESTVNALS